MEKTLPDINKRISREYKPGERGKSGMGQIMTGATREDVSGPVNNHREGRGVVMKANVSGRPMTEYEMAMKKEQGKPDKGAY